MPEVEAGIWKWQFCRAEFGWICLPNTLFQNYVKCRTSSWCSGNEYGGDNSGRPE